MSESERQEGADMSGSVTGVSSPGDDSVSANTSDRMLDLLDSVSANTSDRMLDLLVQLVGDYLILAVSTPLSIFGCFANIISLIIFMKQGRKDCVTVCLFALGVSDFLCCFTVLVFSSMYTSNSVNNNSIIEPLALDVVLSYISALFYDISQGITAFISLQRCLCVAMPLKFKNMFTVNRSVVIMLAFYVLTTAAYTPHFRTSGVYMKVDTARNVTIPALWETSDRSENIFWLNYLLHIGVDTLYQLVVVVSAIVMISGLKRSSKFRYQESKLKSAVDNLASDIESKHNKGLRNQPEHGSKDNKELRNQSEHGSKDNKGLRNQPEHGSKDNKGSGNKPEHATRRTNTLSRSGALSNKNRSVVRTIFALSLMAIVCNTERLSVVYGQRFVPGLTFDGIYQNIFFVSARVTFLFGMANASLNVLVYYLLNPSYRKTFKALFSCRPESELKSNT